MIISEEKNGDKKAVDFLFFLDFLNLSGGVKWF